MIPLLTVYDVLLKNGVNFFTGVPDSLLKHFCAFISDQVEPAEHVITANEGSAVALAAGWHLGTGELALVYLQNSGLGNAINPLSSLADPDVYGIPMVLMIGWRGEPGVKDEPQHVKQGRITPAMLVALELPWFELASTTDAPDELIGEACRSARARSAPAVILVRKGSFETYATQSQPAATYSLSREQALIQIVDHTDPTDLLVSTTGKISRELYELRERKKEAHSRDFLTVGSMGHASSIALGLARAQPDRRVLCLDGDGAAIMHLGSLAIIGQSPASNLVHVVLNNGAHDSVGGQPTVGFEINLAGIARSCGYRQALVVQDQEHLLTALEEVLTTGGGPTFLEVRVNQGARADLGRPRSSPGDNKLALMRHIATTTKGER